MRVLLTGISGFMGGHLARTFQQHEHTVAGIVRSTSRTGSLPSTEFELFQATLEDIPRLREAMKGADVVVHAAAKVHTHGFWRDFARTTIQGTRNVLQAAVDARAPKFIQISTVGIYGFPSGNGGSFAETSGYGRVHRWNYYSRAKIEAEKIALAVHHSGRIAVTILRPTWVYGPRDSTTFDRITDGLRRRRIKWIGDGQNKLSLIHVSDVAQAVVLAAATPQSAGQAYNVAADETSPTQQEFILRICELTHLPPPNSRVPYNVAYAMGFAGEAIAHASRYRVCPPLTRLTVLLLGGRRRFSSDKIRTELGWKPTVTFQEGLSQMAECYLKARKSPSQVPS